MDEFVCSVVPQSFRANVFDVVVSCFNTQLAVFYENKEDDARFMDSSVLNQGFYRALAAFPVYAGELRQSERNGIELVVDANSLNMPGYRETSSDVPFSDIKASRYNPQTWPPELMSFESVPLPDAETGKIPALNAHVVRCKSNSGVALFISGWHAITDGAGYYRFVTRWADEARALVKGTPAPEGKYHFDRAALLSSPDVAGKDSDPGRGAFLQSMVSAERNKAVHDRIVASNNKGNLYLISRDKLDHLRNEILKLAPEISRLSTNDVLAALISKTLAWARKDSSVDEACQTSAPVDDEGAVPLQKVTIPYNVRTMLGESCTNYMGNGLYMPFFTHPLESAASEATLESLAEVAGMVRNTVRSVQKQHITDFFDSVERSPSSFANPLAPTGAVKHATVITNHTSFKVYDIDFGYGIPEFATPRPYLAKVGVKVLPVRPPSRDIYVSIVDSPAMVRSIRKNKFWGSIAELIF